MINILMVDDHLIVREGIKRIINDIPDMNIISEASNGNEAMELILTGGMIDANNALSLGLVNKVVSQENLMEASNEIAVKILKNSSLAIKASIAVINSNYKDGIDGYEVERREFGNCFQSEDFVEGTKAFLEKRRPNFN